MIYFFTMVEEIFQNGPPEIPQIVRNLLYNSSPLLKNIFKISSFETAHISQNLLYIAYHSRFAIMATEVSLTYHMKKMRINCELPAKDKSCLRAPPPAPPPLSTTAKSISFLHIYAHTRLKKIKKDRCWMKATSSFSLVIMDTVQFKSLLNSSPFPPSFFLCSLIGNTKHEILILYQGL